AASVRGARPEPPRGVTGTRPWPRPRDRRVEPPAPVRLPRAREWGRASPRREPYRRPSRSRKRSRRQPPAAPGANAWGRLHAFGPEPLDAVGVDEERVRAIG